MLRLTGIYLNGTKLFLIPPPTKILKLTKLCQVKLTLPFRVSGDSITPRFVDGQVVFVREQQTLEVGEIGVFSLDSDSYIKKLGQGEPLSLNPSYDRLRYKSIHRFTFLGKWWGNVVSGGGCLQAGYDTAGKCLAIAKRNI